MVDDSGLADECSSGECHSENRDTTKVQDSLPTTPPADTNAAATAPLVERRRHRRLAETAATSPASRLDRQSNIDYFNDYYTGNKGRTGRAKNSTTIALLSLLFLVVLVQKNKIIQVIRQSKASEAQRTSPVLRIITAHILLFPVQYIKNVLSEIGSLILHGVIHPMEFPSVVWGLICSLIEDSRMVLNRLYPSLLVVGSVNVTAREGRITRIVGTRVESMPELENEEICSILNMGGDLKGQDTIRKKNKQQGPDTNIEQETKSYDLNRLPPAFLSEKDYPKGWLEYHPIHGVITRDAKLELNGTG